MPYVRRGIALGLLERAVEVPAMAVVSVAVTRRGSRVVAYLGNGEKSSEAHLSRFIACQSRLGETVARVG